MFVDWTGLSRDNWDDLVEVLLCRMYADGIHKVVVYNGRGGDEGRDVVVTRPDGYIRIFQLKHFPGGFPGTSSRRGQITRSFKSALQHEPDEWTLVVPENLTSGERTFIQKLSAKAAGKVPVITDFAETCLNSELAKYPDIRTAFERNEIERLMDLFNLEGRVAPGNPATVEARIAGTTEAIDAADPDWTVRFSNIPGHEGRVLVPKHANAHLRSPVSVEVHADTTKLTDELNAKISAMFGYGLDGEVEIPADAVSHFEIKGPPIAAEARKNVAVILGIGSNVPTAAKELEVAFLQSDGQSISSQTGILEHGMNGAFGTSLRIRFFNTVRLVVLLPHDLSVGVETTINCDIAGASLSDTVDGLAFFLQAFSGVQIDIRLPNGERLALGALTGSSVDLDGVKYTYMMAVDLQVVQKGLKQSFPLPVTHNKNDSVMIRALRLIVEGKRARLPGVTTMPITFTRTDAQNEHGLLYQSISGTPLSLWANTEDRTPIKVFGKKLLIPYLSIGAPEVIFANRSEIIDTLDNHPEIGILHGELGPADGGFMSGVGRSFVRDVNQPLPLAPWNLPGVEDLPEAWVTDD